MAVYQSIGYGVFNAVFNAMPKGGGGGRKNNRIGWKYKNEKCNKCPKIFL